MRRKPAACSKAFSPRRGTCLQLGAGGEAAVFGAEGDDVFRDGIAEAGDEGEQVLGGGVELYADAVDAGFDGVVEGGFEGALVDIVLVLADADGFGVDFHELGEGIHEAAADGDGAADGDVFVGEFLTGGFARRSRWRRRFH